MLWALGSKPADGSSLCLRVFVHLFHLFGWQGHSNKETVREHLMLYLSNDQNILRLDQDEVRRQFDLRWCLSLSFREYHSWKLKLRKELSSKLQPLIKDATVFTSICMWHNMPSTRFCFLLRIEINFVHDRERIGESKREEREHEREMANLWIWTIT